jgi:hypothetical protein
MNVPERLREVARHLRANCQLCRHQGGSTIADLARSVSAVDMADHALELDRIALWLDNAGIHEIPRGREKRERP